jgi:aryl-alcohol dehydrogenase-like predicted oxidoreductase
MKFRKLGTTGIKVSEIGFGAWAIGGSWAGQQEDDSIAALHKALDLGVNFIDTAFGYGMGKSEQIIGKVLKARKEKVIIASKIPPDKEPWPPSPYCAARERYPESYIRKMTELSLKNLGRDYIDIMQLHTWTRAWNRDPVPLEYLARMKEEGKVRFIGVSTPEHDQNALIDLMRSGIVDSVQVIYNIFEQEPAAEFLPTALKCGTGVIVRMAFDEGVLTGKYKADHVFPKDDFRSRYFAGDRIARAVGRVEKIGKEIEGSGYTVAEAALKFSMMHPAVSTVIAGMRNSSQTDMNIRASGLPDLPAELILKLRDHAWLRAFWYSGK